eukprot:TRINITY_DN19803_c0_g1_i1.p1 TRINITY_DN19803_c0_g1~~TRINITY_DN19803_c0_g1_i1.p1  ORF type:complete len:280 (+),score=38.07 TRINITY_DN19803_c0_g1_i1:72-842(+)
MDYLDCWLCTCRTTTGACTRSSRDVSRGSFQTRSESRASSAGPPVEEGGQDESLHMPLPSALLPATVGQSMRPMVVRHGVPSMYLLAPQAVTPPQPVPAQVAETPAQQISQERINEAQKLLAAMFSPASTDASTVDSRMGTPQRRRSKASRAPEASHATDEVQVSWPEPQQAPFWEQLLPTPPQALPSQSTTTTSSTIRMVPLPLPTPQAAPNGCLLGATSRRQPSPLAPLNGCMMKGIPLQPPSRPSRPCTACSN